jgi:hypothetical protein
MAKTKKKAKLKSNTIEAPTAPGIQTIYHRLSDEAATATVKEFLEKDKAGEAENCFIDNFLMVMGHITKTLELQAFTVLDVITYSKPFNIPIDGPRGVKVLFEKWLSKMVSLGKCEVVRGVYDDEIIIYN